MRLQILELKAKMEREGVTALDLLEANIVVDFLSAPTQITRVFTVTDRHIARPDLLSFDAYGTVNYVDVILKFNQITNPFSMEVGDIILVPSIVAIDQLYRKTQSSDSLVKDTKSLFVDPARASQKDQARIRQLEKIAAKSKGGAREVKPTNLLRKGEKPFRSDGDSLKLAPDSSGKVAPKARPKPKPKPNGGGKLRKGTGPSDSITSGQ